MKVREKGGRGSAETGQRVYKGAAARYVFCVLVVLYLPSHYSTTPQWQIFGAGGALIQKKNKEKEKGKGKEERREKRKKERGEFNLEDPMFLFNFHSFFQKIIK